MASISRILIDLISDLHIDQWDNKYNIKFPYGIPKKLENFSTTILLLIPGVSKNKPAIGMINPKLANSNKEAINISKSKITAFFF